MQIVIDKDTREKVRKKFDVNYSFMTRALNYQNNGILARRIRHYIMNFKEFHIIK